MTKATRIIFRCTEEKKAAWEAKAKQAGMTLTEYIEIKLDNPVVYTEPPAKEPIHTKTERPFVCLLKNK